MAATETSFKERQRRAREEAILETAEALVSEHGLHALSLDDIATQVGIAKGTIYLHFPSKDHLLAALIVRGMERMRSLVDTLDPAQPVLERLRRVMSELMLRHREFDSMHSVSQEIQEAKRILASDERCLTSTRELRARLGTLVEEGKRNGEIDPTLHTDAVVGALFTLSGPARHRMIAGTETSPSALNDSLIRLYLRGIAAHGNAETPAHEQSATR